MSRPVTLFTGQWADLPVARMLEKAAEFGYDGVELACWGDHFEVGTVLKSKAHRNTLRALLDRNGLKCWAVGAHLVGQAVCDNIDERHKAILPPHVWGNGKPEEVRKRAAKELIETAKAAAACGIKIVTGFTGSSIWHLLYAFPPVPPAMIEAGYKDFAKRFKPILDAFQKAGVKFALEVHPTEIAFDIATAERALEAVKGHPAFGFNYDPSHLGYQGVDYVEFLYRFRERIFHVHMKDAEWKHHPCSDAGVFGGNLPFGDNRRFWDFRSVGRGAIDFERIIRALNEIGYKGPLSVEWEDPGMDREHGAAESCAYTREVDFKPSAVAFDAAFEKKKK
jgi:sugar phosphate isomerase/epimerase